jgi:SAM-dependent methyltransferase
MTMEARMESTRERHEHRAHHGSAAGHGHGDDHRWSDESFVSDWIDRQEAHAAERRPLFAKVRALIPNGLSESFRYADLGAGAGNLDELMLERFTNAQAVLIDGSEPMLAHARARLARFGERAQYITADLSQPGWVAVAHGPFDAVVAARAVHHAGSADRIRELFREIREALAPGGVFVNLDYVRLASLSLPLRRTSSPGSGRRASPARNACTESFRRSLSLASATSFGCPPGRWKVSLAAIPCGGGNTGYLLDCTTPE